MLHCTLTVHILGHEKTAMRRSFQISVFNRDFGSPGQARTADLVINSHPLYRLSYRGIAFCESRK
jgi:hypothetical protein